MENPITFELRYAAHQQRVARINVEVWQHQAAPSRIRTALANVRVILAARLARPKQAAPEARPVGEATTSPAL
jgi:hypothetical protein